MAIIVTLGLSGMLATLGPTLEGLSGVSGFTILGSGDAALILDVPGLVRRQTQSLATGWAESRIRCTRCRSTR